jgi:hypothetical protein
MNEAIQVTQQLTAEQAQQMKRGKERMLIGSSSHEETELQTLEDDDVALFTESL